MAKRKVTYVRVETALQNSIVNVDGKVLKFPVQGEGEVRYHDLPATLPVQWQMTGTPGSGKLEITATYLTATGQKTTKVVSASLKNGVAQDRDLNGTVVLS